MKSYEHIMGALGIPPLPSCSSESVSALMWAREVMQDHLKRLYAVTNPKGIEELKSISIGGVDQWLHIRGRNRHNPVLLFLHGGPGFGNIGWMDAIQRPWEDYFTVVQWDQRQTGKSYYPSDDDKHPLTVDRFIEDSEEVIRYLREYLEKDKLFVLGASWGTVLGMHMVKRHPDWISAYVGVGQIVSWTDNERVIYERLLDHAREQNEIQLIDKLESIAPFPDPDNLGKSMAENHMFILRELSRLAGETLIHHQSFDETVKAFSFERLMSPHLTQTDISNSVLGDEIALYRPPYYLAEEFMKVDLPNDLGSSFEAPVFFFTGSHEWHTPRILSDKWFDKIDAPCKELVHFKESAHGVLMEEPGKVLVALINKVLPFSENVPCAEINNV